MDTGSIFLKSETYRKILGLKLLEKMCFPVPPYSVIDIKGDAPSNIEAYVLGKIREVKIPVIRGDRVGVTIRVSLPEGLDKIAKHGGLHLTNQQEILKNVLEKYKQYGAQAKIIIQHTVDAKCSGTILKENDYLVVEAIPGDAPALLEGVAEEYERWVYTMSNQVWRKDKAYTKNGEMNLLEMHDLRNLQSYAQKLIGNAYLEWSIAKNGKIYFYEYYSLK
jgi:hypothetical protein